MARSQDHGGGSRAAARRPRRAGAVRPEAPPFHIGPGPVPHAGGAPAGGSEAAAGALVFVADGRAVEPPGGAGRVIGSGDVALFDASAARRPWPCDGPALTLPLARTALPGPGGAGRDVLLLPRAGTEVLRDMLGSLARHGTDLPQRQAATAVATVMALLRESLAPDAAAAPGPAPGKVDAVLAFIEAALFRPDLTPATVAAGTGLSRSVLYRLLAPEGGVAAYVKRRRLDALRRALAARDDPRSIAEIAADHGFSDPSHAHRAFREAFGLTPGEVRRDGSRPGARAADPPRAGRPAPRRSGDCSE